MSHPGGFSLMTSHRLSGASRPPNQQMRFTDATNGRQSGPAVGVGAVAQLPNTVNARPAIVALSMPAPVVATR